ncbi:dediator complex, subunit Med6, partial [Kipferlia bialata]
LQEYWNFQAFNGNDNLFHLYFRESNFHNKMSANEVLHMQGSTGLEQAAYDQQIREITGRTYYIYRRSSEAAPLSLYHVLSLSLASKPPFAI